MTIPALTTLGIGPGGSILYLLTGGLDMSTAIPGQGMDLELQGAIQAHLSLNAPLQALIGNPIRMYQQVSPTAQKPYITIGETQEIDDSVECLDAAEIFVNIHIWTDSTAKDFREAKRIASAIRRALQNVDLVLTENRCVQIEHRITRNMVDPDNITRHSVMTFRAQTEENLD